MILNKLSKVIARGKFYLNRASSYLAIVNLALLLNLSFDSYLMKALSIIFGLAGLILFGMFEVHIIKTYDEENKYIHRTTVVHPILIEMNERIKKIEEKL